MSTLSAAATGPLAGKAFRFEILHRGPGKDCRCGPFQIPRSRWMIEILLINNMLRDFVRHLVAWAVSGAASLQNSPLVGCIGQGRLEWPKRNRKVPNAAESKILVKAIIALRFLGRLPKQCDVDLPTIQRCRYVRATQHDRLLQATGT